MNHRVPFALLIAPMLVLLLLGAGCDVLQPAPTPDRAATSAAETKAITARVTAQVPTATPVPPTATRTPTATRIATPTSTPVRLIPTWTPVPAKPLPATPVPATPMPSGTKQITLVVVERWMPVPGRAVWMGYFDENIQTWVTTTRITDPDGIAVFQVPVSQSGESFAFTFSGSDIELPRLYAEISNSRWSAFKIPSAPAQTGVTLEMDPSRLTFRTIEGLVNVRIMK